MSGEVSETKIERFRSVLSRVREKGVKIIVVDSPRYITTSGTCASVDIIKSLCKEYGARFIDNSQLAFFLERPELFNDATHLNDDGAKIYTEMFLEEISGWIEVNGHSKDCDE